MNTANTQLELLKNELLAQKEIVNLMQELAHIGTWELDLRDNTTNWSDENFKIFARKKEKGVPTHEEFLSMVIDQDKQTFLNARKRVLQEHITSIEIKVRKDDGSIATIIMVGKLFYHNNRAAKIVGINLDISEIKKRDNIIFAQAKLAQMGDMFTMIAHQWRQPLNAINAAAIKLGMKNQLAMVTPQEIEKTVAFIEKITQELSQTIETFLDFSNPRVEKETFLLDEFMQNLEHIIQPKLQEEGIVLTYTIAPKEATLRTYKKDLEYILINLIKNAQEAYTQEETKTIHIDIQKHTYGCTIVVCDNAGGIQETILQRVFEPYFSTKEDAKGLGLYMSQKILIETLQGALSLQNINDGLCCTLDLKDLA